MVPIFEYGPTLSLLYTITFHFHNFFSLFMPKFSITVYTLFSVHNQIKGFGLWWPYAMCLWPYVPEFLRWAALKNALSYYSTNVYVRMYVYVCLDSPNLRACPCYVRACVRAHADTHQRRACSYYQRPAPAMHAHPGKFFVKLFGFKLFCQMEASLLCRLV